MCVIRVSRVPDTPSLAAHFFMSQLGAVCPAPQTPLPFQQCLSSTDDESGDGRDVIKIEVHLFYVFQLNKTLYFIVTLRSFGNIMVWGQYRLAHPSPVNAFSDDTGKIV